MKIPTIALLLSITLTLHSEEPEKITIITRDGKTIEGAKIKRVETDAITFTHAGGIARIPFENLSDELQKKYNFDPKAATKVRNKRQAMIFEQQQKALTSAAEEAEVEQLLDSMEDITFEVFKVMKTGVIAWNLQHTKDHVVRYAKGRQAVIIDVDAYELYEGQTVRLDAAPYGTVDVNGSTLKCWINIPSD